MPPRPRSDRRELLGIPYDRLTYNVAEAVVAIAAGAGASSAALVGFGLDSTIE